MAIMEKLDVERLLRGNTWLDHFGESVQQAVNAAFEDSGQPGIVARNFLNGTWLGHPLHAALSDTPIGLWTGTAIFDLVGLVTGARRFQRAADLCAGLGVGAAILTAMAGLADFSKVEDPAREEAALHGIINGVALSTYVSSLIQRSRGNRGAAVLLGLLGYGLITVGADLGGHLVYNLGTLVSRQAWKNPPGDFTAVLPSSVLGEGEMRSANANGFQVLLARVNGEIYAIGNVCTHWGCSLAEGRLLDRTVQCPCHGSEFSLRNGLAVRGPASEPEPFFEVRERNGQIEVRLAPISVPV